MDGVHAIKGGAPAGVRGFEAVRLCGGSDQGAHWTKNAGTLGWCAEFICRKGGSSTTRMIIIRVLAEDVIQYHVWRALRVDPQWGEDCQETSLLVGYYGKNGSRYEDSRVVDMINDTSQAPRTNTMDRFLRFLRHVDDCFTQDAFRKQSVPISRQDRCLGRRLLIIRTGIPCERQGHITLLDKVSPNS